MNAKICKDGLIENRTVQVEAPPFRPIPIMKPLTEEEKIMAASLGLCPADFMIVTGSEFKKWLEELRAKNNSI